MTQEKDEASYVRRQGKEANSTHCRGVRRYVRGHLEDTFDQDSETKEHHDDALHHRGSRAPDRSTVEDVQGDGVDGRVAQHVERLTQERG